MTNGLCFTLVVFKQVVSFISAADRNHIIYIIYFLRNLRVLTKQFTHTMMLRLHKIHFQKFQLLDSFHAIYHFLDLITKQLSLSKFISIICLKYILIATEHFHLHIGMLEKAFYYDLQVYCFFHNNQLVQNCDCDCALKCWYSGLLMKAVCVVFIY